MSASKTITFTIFLLTFCVTAMRGQSTNESLKRKWELVTVEPIGVGMGGLGEEMKILDLRHETQLVFEDNGQSDTLFYKVIDQEIRLFDKDENPIGYDLIWKIEQLTEREFSLLFIAREDNQDLVRLRYRAKD